MQSIFITKIIKVGNSFGVLIPQEILNGYHWQRGDFVIFGFAPNDQLYLKRLTDLEINQIKPDVNI